VRQIHPQQQNWPGHSTTQFVLSAKFVGYNSHNATLKQGIRHWQHDALREIVLQKSITTTGLAMVNLPFQYPEPPYNNANFPDAFLFCMPTIEVPGHQIHIPNPPTTMHVFPKACDRTLFTSGPGGQIHIPNPPTTLHSFSKACDWTLCTFARQPLQYQDI
jgi:hypothetical protein